MPEELSLLMEKVEEETKEAPAPPAPSYVPRSLLSIFCSYDITSALLPKPLSQSLRRFPNLAPWSL